MKKPSQKIVEQSLKFMLAKILLGSFLFFSTIGVAAPIQSFSPGMSRPAANAPTNAPRPVQNDDTRFLKASITDLKNEVQNHEVEIRNFEQRLHNQETAMDHFHEHVTADLQVQKDYTRATFVDLQSKVEAVSNQLTKVDGQLSNLTQTTNGLTTDLRNFKTQSNEGVQVLELYKQKLNELENKIASQNTHIANLESALQSIMELFQAKEAVTPKYASNLGSGSNSGNFYLVQSGDNLEKIARKHNTTVKQLMDNNPELNGHLIRPGQKIMIP